MTFALWILTTVASFVALRLLGDDTTAAASVVAYGLICLTLGRYYQDGSPRARVLRGDTGMSLERHLKSGVIRRM